MRPITPPEVTTSSPFLSDLSHDSVSLRRFCSGRNMTKYIITSSSGNRMIGLPNPPCVQPPAPPAGGVPVEVPEGAADGGAAPDGPAAGAAEGGAAEGGPEACNNCVWIIGWAYYRAWLHYTTSTFNSISRDAPVAPAA